MQYMKKSIYTKEYLYVVDQLKKARGASRMRQNVVADKLGRTQSYISKVEAGQLRIDVVQLQELARLYKKPIKYFIRKQK